MMNVSNGSQSDSVSSFMLPTTSNSISHVSSNHPTVTSRCVAPEIVASIRAGGGGGGNGNGNASELQLSPSASQRTASFGNNGTQHHGEKRSSASSHSSPHVTFSSTSASGSGGSFKIVLPPHQKLKQAWNNIASPNSVPSVMSSSSTSVSDCNTKYSSHASTADSVTNLFALNLPIAPQRPLQIIGNHANSHLISPNSFHPIPYSSSLNSSPSASPSQSPSTVSKLQPPSHAVLPLSPTSALPPPVMSGSIYSDRRLNTSLMINTSAPPLSSISTHSTSSLFLSSSSSTSSLSSHPLALPLSLPTVHEGVTPPGESTSGSRSPHAYPTSRDYSLIPTVPPSEEVSHTPPPPRKHVTFETPPMAYSSIVPNDLVAYATIAPHVHHSLRTSTLTEEVVGASKPIDPAIGHLISTSFHPSSLSSSPCPSPSSFHRFAQTPTAIDVSLRSPTASSSTLPTSSVSRNDLGRLLLSSFANQGIRVVSAYVKSNDANEEGKIFKRDH